MTAVEQLREIVERYVATWHYGYAQLEVVPGEGEIPYSELAMHTRIAGTTPDAVAVVYHREDNGTVRPGWAYVLHGNSFTDGLYAEVVPWEMRARLYKPTVAA